MVPLLRDFRVEFLNPNVAIGFQKALGQVLFNPPNVAGWPGGRNWIDSSSLAFRMRLGRVLLSEELASIESKPDGDDNNAFRDKLGADEGMKIRSDWKKVDAYYSGLQRRKIGWRLWPIIYWLFRYQLIIADWQNPSFKLRVLIRDYVQL